MASALAISFLLLGYGLLVSATQNYRIVGGTRASILEYPYMTIIWYTEGLETVQFCGGAILNNRYVLTASHCVSGIEPEALSVTVGATMADHRDGTTYKVSRGIDHEDYDDQLLHNDIGLIKIIGSFIYGPTVQKIPVAASKLKLRPGTKCVIAGWGDTLSRSHALHLKMAVVPIVEPEVCAMAYSKINNITDKMICCGYDDGLIDTCQGDSGGPLVYRGQLVGVVSFGVGCARPKTPGIYTKVSKYMKWIVKNAI